MQKFVLTMYNPNTDKTEKIIVSNEQDIIDLTENNTPDTDGLELIDIREIMTNEY